MIGAEATPGAIDLRASRRRLGLEAVGIGASALGFGLVFGLAARNAGYSALETVAMSTIVFAGASQFAAVGLVTGGVSWPAIALLTGLLNSRHLLYSAALAPWLRERPRALRAVMAHVLTDESFALSLVHFRRIGRADPAGYWIAAIGAVFIPWNLATIAGYLGGQTVPDPRVLALDMIFPAAMAGLAVALVGGRREVVAATVGAAVAVGLGLALEPAVAIVAGGLAGPLAGLAVPRRRRSVPESDELPADPDRMAAFRGRSDDGLAP